MDAATIDQMNKVRASVGLPPLPVPGQSSNGQQPAADEEASDDEDDISTFDKRQAAASKNWQKLEDERLEKLSRQQRKDQAKKARDIAQRQTKLEGKGLGDADDDGALDTRTWLLQQKKRQKKIDQARKLEAELQEREQQMQAAYTSRDLAGVKVGHELDEFDEMTGEQILTLKDTEIGEDSEDDELENEALRAKEKLNERLQSKKKRADYDPTEQSESTAVLSKYDEEIDGKQKKRFVLDGKGTSAAARKEKTAQEGGMHTSRGVKISLDMLQDDQPLNDYADAKPVKMKKSKKKDKKTRVKAADDDDIVMPTSRPDADADAMDVDGSAPRTSKKRGLEFDDDDLQARIAAQRQEALKKRKKMDATELAKQMREEIPIDEQEMEEGGLLIDETAEFVANLKKPELANGSKSQSRAEVPVTEQRDQLDEDMEMADRQPESEDEEETPIRDAATAKKVATDTGLEDEEGTSGRGLGGSVALLRKRGIINDGQGDDLAEKNRQRNRFLEEKQKMIDDFDKRAREQREAERQTGRWERMSNRERDTYAQQQNEARERYLSRLQADMFNKEYKPDVKLEYYDEYGRSMNQKEAFKHLSHSFHGKTSGKQKTEKRLQRIENEKKQMSKGLLSVMMRLTATRAGRSRVFLQTCLDIEQRSRCGRARYHHALRSILFHFVR